tara:strand:- start:12482 stop:13777 length:1296 start_codon:yes stop_codon:yes gene_type:complete
MNRDWDKVVMGVPYWKECLRVLKAGSLIFVMSAPRQDVLSRAIINLQDAGFNVSFTSLYHCYASGFPKASNIGKMVDKRLGKKVENKSEFTDFSKTTDTTKHIQRHKKCTDCKKLLFGQDPCSCEWRQYKTQTPQAKVLDGSYGGFQPKPAVEVILVAMKPLDCKTYVDQAMKNGKGISWLDNARIPYQNDYDEKHQADIQRGQDNASKGKMFASETKSQSSGNLQGRFPANLLSSDNVLDDGRVSSSGNSEANNYDKFGGQWGQGKQIRNADYGDTGSFNRYFDLDKWAEKLPESVQKVFPFLIVPKAGKGEKNKGCDELEEKPLAFSNQAKAELARGNYNFDGDGAKGHGNKIRYLYNNHPTAKPIKLMSYLITLGSREGDIVLDPFAGSCTTAIAAKMLRREFIMVEKEKEYCEIGKARIDAVQEPML